MATTPSIQVQFSEFREKLAGYMDRCAKFGDRIFISRHAQQEAVLLSRQEWDEISATLEVLNDPALLEQIVESQRDIAAGRHRPARDVLSDIAREL